MHSCDEINLPDTAAAQVATDATSLCTQRRAMYILDVPQQSADRDTVEAIMTWLKMPMQICEAATRCSTFLEWTSPIR